MVISILGMQKPFLGLFWGFRGGSTENNYGKIENVGVYSSENDRKSGDVSVNVKFQ